VYPGYPGEPARPGRPAGPPLTKRLRTVHWIAIDCVVAAFAAIFMVAVLHAPVPVESGAGPLGPVQVITSPHSAFPAGPLLAAGTFIPIAFRRRAPVLAFGALILLGTLLIGTAEIRSAVFFLGAAYVLYMVTVTSSRRTGVAALVVGVSVLALVSFGTQRGAAVNSGALVPVAFAMVIAWIIGYSVRQRRLYILTLQHQAASSAVAEERLRIARELHDVVAHSMAVIAVQAGYGQYVIDASPQGAKEALDAIQATSRDALDEMRRMLGVLRQQDSGQQGSGQQGSGQPDSAVAGGLTDPGAVPAPGPGGVIPDSAGAVLGRGSRRGARGASDAANGASGRGAANAASGRGAANMASGRGAANAASGRGAPSAASGSGAGAGSRVSAAPLAPAPGLADLGRLIERTGRAGITVSLEISGTARPVPASVDLSAYRIIQEALTNVVKHAGGGAACAIVVRYTDAELVVRVTDDGGEDLVLSPAGLAPRAAPVVGGGHGIIGMRERAALCGGQFSAGPRGNGGWHVSAMLPLRAPGTDEA
jgi:signal transduction histidine kinase